MENPSAYLPMDRRFALAGGTNLADRTQGAALFVDISGFTALTEALVRELGAQRGAEELTRYLNLVYDAVIDELHRYGGSVIAFAGDAITCWIDGDSGLRAIACGLAMQNAMKEFGNIQTPAGSLVSLAMKAAVASGPVRRFLVGNPGERLLDVIAGNTLVRLANAEHLAKRGEVVIDSASLERLSDELQLLELRHDPKSGERVGVIAGLRQNIADAPWNHLAEEMLPDDVVRTWLLPQVYERLQQGLGNFLAELRPTVALFLRFSGIDYDQDEAAGDKLDSYIRWIQHVVASYEGTLIDLNIGDKGSYLYINFGAPIAHEDNAERAAAAALSLRNQLEHLNFIDTVQIGISQGRMRAGAYGGKNHRTYGVLGDEVNMAARLMMAAQPGQIIVSLAARQSMGAGFVLDELPSIRVKGKSDAVNIFALLDRQQVQGSLVASGHYSLPMIGRQRELLLIEQKMAEAALGSGQIVSLAGEAGLGKSRLVAEVIQRAAANHFVIVGSQCESYAVNSSYQAWQPVWRAIFGLDATASSAEQISDLRDQLYSIHPTLPSRLPLLSTLLNLEIPENDLTQSLDAKLRKSLLEALLVECLRAKARHKPLLIVLEACQWLDPLSSDLLVALAQAIPHVSVCLLLVYRPAETESLATAIHAPAHHSEISLSLLTDEEVAQFIQAKLTQLLGVATVAAPNLVERIIAQADGNPFYIEELINYLHLRGVDFQNDAALEQIELPDSLQRLVLSLVDQLSESQKITIKVASVIGRIFRAAWLYGVYPELGDARRVQSDLETLQQQELMLSDPNEPELVYLFRQVITQGVTYESLPHALKTSLHEQIGRFIEARYPDALEPYLDLLAYHYDHSANDEKRRYYLRRAGEAAQANYANVVAINYFERLLPLLADVERGALLLRVGEIFDTLGDYAQADARFQEALALTAQQHNLHLQAQCQIALGELRRKQSQYEEAARYFTQAQSLTAQIGDQAGMAKALVCAGSLALYQGNYGDAQTLYSQSLAIRRQLDDQPNIAKVLNNLAITAANQVDFSLAQSLFEQSLAIRRQLQDKWGVATSLNNLGQLALDQQAYDEARTFLEEAVASQRVIGDKWMLGNSLLNLGNALRGLGDYAAAYPLYIESLQINRDLGDRWMLAYLLENIGSLLAQQGEASKALQLVAAAATLRETLGIPLSPTDKSQLEGVLEPARERLGGVAAADAWATGQMLTLEQSIAIALNN